MTQRDPVCPWPCGTKSQPGTRRRYSLPIWLWFPPLHMSSCVCVYFYSVSSLVYVCVSTPTIKIRSSSNIPRVPFSFSCNQGASSVKCERLKTEWVQGKEKNRGKTLGDKIRNMCLLSAPFPEAELLNPLNFLWKFFFCLRRQLLVGS